MCIRDSFKSKLIEWAQKNKKDISFNTREDGIDTKLHLPLFISEVEIEKIKMGKGIGSSKKESQQNAARETLKRIDS